MPSGGSIPILSNISSLLREKVNARNLLSTSKQKETILLDNLLNAMNKLRDDPVSSLSNSCKWRKQLLQLSSEIGIADEPCIRMALRRDDEQVATLFQEILTLHQKSVLALVGEAAVFFMNAVQEVLDRGFLTGDFNRKAHRLIVQLSRGSGAFPSSLMLLNITLLDHNAVAEGGFGTIFRGKYGNQVVALKCLRLRLNQETQKTRQRFHREVLIWRSLEHPYILPFLGVDCMTFSFRPCLVSPWLARGTVSDFLKRCSCSSLNIVVPALLYEIAIGVGYLHSEAVIHGDLKADNILVDDNGHARLCDFGMARLLEGTNTGSSTGGHGTIRWMAPELFVLDEVEENNLTFAPKPTTASDIYSFGCVCFELYTGRYPFWNLRIEPQVILQIIRGGRPKFPPRMERRCVDIPDDIWKLVHRCWSQVPDERPSIDFIVQRIHRTHPGAPIKCICADGRAQRTRSLEPTVEVWGASDRCVDDSRLPSCQFSSSDVSLNSTSGVEPALI